MMCFPTSRFVSCVGVPGQTAVSISATGHPEAGEVPGSSISAKRGRSKLPPSGLLLLIASLAGAGPGPWSKVRPPDRLMGRWSWSQPARLTQVCRVASSRHQAEQTGPPNLARPMQQDLNEATGSGGRVYAAEVPSIAER